MPFFKQLKNVTKLHAYDFCNKSFGTDHQLIKKGITSAGPWISFFKFTVYVELYNDAPFMIFENPTYITI